MKELINKLKAGEKLTKEELIALMDAKDCADYLRESAFEVRKRVFGNKVYLRGLIEISSICKNDCIYCGIRASNPNAVRCRMNADEILSAAEVGKKLGFSTYVLQGGEDLYYTDTVLCDIIDKIKTLSPDAAITLSLGERSYESYKALKNAGADRYLLRHETANAVHYGKLHPAEMSLDTRKECLYNLKELGYQVGSGFMVGSPYQTTAELAEDILFLEELMPDMIGIGPFIPHKDTPFAEFEAGSVELTLRLISILRLRFPEALLPSTTALATLSPDGRERGLLCGANVVMPNLSPESVRESYKIYDNKLSVGAESAEGIRNLKDRIESVGLTVDMSRGDAPRIYKERNS